MVIRRAGRTLGAVGVALVVLAACTNSEPGRESVPSTSTTAGGGATGAGAVPARTLEGWARSTSEALNKGEAAATLAAVLPPAGDDGWVVVGTSFDGAGVSRATVWRSRDALKWRDAAVGGPRTEGFDATRRDDGTLIVVGRVITGDSSRAAAWVEDGSTFTSAGGTDALAGGDQVAMTVVAARPAGLVALGSRSQEGKADTLAAWRSPTGETWERLPAAEAVFAASGQPFVNTVMAVPAGLVAVGGVRKGDDVDAAAWFSADGAAWEATTAAPDFAGPGVQSVEDVVALPDGLLAVGSASDGRRRIPAAWRSADGRAWAPANATFPLLGDASDTFGTQISTVRKTTGALVATGGGAAVQRFWVSADGTTWEEVQLPGEAAGADSFNLDLLATAGNDVVAGSTIDGVPRIVLLRDGQYNEVTARNAGFPAPRANPCCVELTAVDSRLAATVDVTRAGRKLGSERNDVQVFGSMDGLAWTATKGGPFDRAVVYGLGSDPSGGLIAAGGLVPARTSGGRHAFSTYVFDDGEWRRDEVVPLPGDKPEEGGTRHFGGLATRDGRMVVAGTAFVGAGASGNVDGAIFTKDGDGPLTAVEGVPGLTGTGDEYADAACAGPLGFLVAGSVREGADRNAAAWFSPDGRTWLQVGTPSFGGAGDQAIEDCVSTPGGFVAAGASSTGDLADPAVWTSPDGVAWSRVDSPALGGDDGQFVSGLAADGPEVVAVGADGRTGEFEVALWHSGDSGATWDRVELGKPFAADRYSVASAIVISGDRVVMGGLVDDRVAIWAGPWPLRRSA